MKKKLLVTLILQSMRLAGIAQCSYDSTNLLDGNQVSALFWNAESDFWDHAYAFPYYEVPKGSEHNSAFAGSLWIAGKDPQGNTHLAAQMYNQSGDDFFSGPYHSTGLYPGNTISPNINTRRIPTGVSGRNPFLRHSGGKILVKHQYGFDVIDPVNDSLFTRLLFPALSDYDAIELANGKVLFMENTTINSTVVRTVLADPVHFVTAAGPVWQLPFFNHSCSILLNSGQVFIQSSAGAFVVDTLNFIPVHISGSPNMQGCRLNLLPNGKVLISACEFLQGIPSSITYLFDPVTNTLSQGPNLNCARREPGIVTLVNGDLIFVGGEDSLGIIERYNTAANAFSVEMNYIPNLYPVWAVNMIGNEMLVSGREYPGGRFIHEIVNINQHSRVPIGMCALNLLKISPSRILVMKDQINYDYFNPPLRQFENTNFNIADVYNLTRSQIAQFQSDFQNNTVDFSHYPDIQSWPGNGNTTMGEDALLAPFADVNHDNLYRPAQDGDYPLIRGDESVYKIFNDDAGTHTETGGQKLGVQVKYEAYEFNCAASTCPDTFMDYTTFHHFEVTNKSAEVYHDFRLSYFLDGTIGNDFDDFVGCDTALGLAYFYNGDANDEAVFGYGLNPPALGLLTLCTPAQAGMQGCMFFENDFSVRGNPQTGMDYYHYMHSEWKDGSHLVSNNLNGYAGTANGPNTDFVFPGDPGACGASPQGWSEVSAGNAPYDRRLLVNTGSVTLNPGQTVTFDFALIWSRAFFNDNLGSVCKLRQDAATLRAWWPQQSFGCALPLSTGTHVSTGFEVYPNPCSASFRIKKSGSAAEADISVVDVSGRMVLSQAMPPGAEETQIFTHGWIPGLYFVHIRDAAGNSSTQKLIVRP